MPLKVYVKDFQSISEATLNIDGFTAITGPNNTGKSAFLRAIQGLVSNAKGFSFVRKGALHCTVKITFDDDVSITWQKGKKLNRYRINEGDWFEKVSRGVPEPVSQILKINSLAIGNSTVTPQIGEQFTGQVFLLNQPGSTLAEAISDVERVGRLNKALKLTESKNRKVKSTLKVRKKDIKELEEKLETYKGLDHLLEKVTQLESLQAHTIDTEEKLKVLKLLRKDWDVAKENVQYYESIIDVSLPSKEKLRKIEKYIALSQVLKGLKQEFDISKCLLESLGGVLDVQVPSTEVVQQITKYFILLDLLVSTQKDYVEAQREAQRLSPLTNVKIPNEEIVYKVQTNLIDIGELRGFYQEASTLKKEVQRLSTLQVQIPPIEDVRSDMQTLGWLTEVFANISKVTTDISSQEESLQIREQIPAINTTIGSIQETFNLLSVASKKQTERSQILSEITVQESQVQKKEKELESACKNIKDLLQQMPACPTCGTKAY